MTPPALPWFPSPPAAPLTPSIVISASYPGDLANLDPLDPDQAAKLLPPLGSTQTTLFKTPALPCASHPRPPLYPGDLANLDALDPDQAAKLPHLMSLRDAIYSPQFRK